MTQIEARSDVAAIKAQVAAAVTRALRESGDAIEEDVVEGMFGSHGGRRYRRASGGTYYTHEASQPGNPPAVDTETLVKSVDVAVMRPDEVQVGMRDQKAPWLEFGTEATGGYIEPRPSLGPAVVREGKRFVARLAKAMAR